MGKTVIQAKFKKQPQDKDFNPKTDIDWEQLSKDLKVKLVSYGGVLLSEASMRAPMLPGTLGGTGQLGKQKYKGQKAGLKGKIKLPLKIFARNLDGGGRIIVREDGRVWLDGPDFINIMTSKPKEFADILTRHASHGLSPVESQTYYEREGEFRLTGEGAGMFSGYDLIPALVEARDQGLDLKMENAAQEPVTWVFGSKGGGSSDQGGKDQKKG